MTLLNSYKTFKDYSTPGLTQKDIERLKDEVWRPLRCTTDMSFLEIGCGTGHCLAFLQYMQVNEFLGIDQDAELQRVVPESLAGNFKTMDIWSFFEVGAKKMTLDRVIMLDVFEHFTVEEGSRLLEELKRRLKPGGAVLLRMPNASSPLGLQYQFGDLTHKTAYSPGNIRQLAIAAGYKCTECYPHRQGSPMRRFLDPILQRVINRLVMTPLEIWSANFYAILEPEDEAQR
ncbi:MAG: class I SAM-dependent methyltransferase [Pseudomonadota bacterium]|nr:class I SAM-dependent methyltransferase [Pseudomonadota bacterium]